MTSVSLRQLKNNLSEYVRRAANGELVQVTDRGKVVAELRPPQGEFSEYPLLRDAVARGSVRQGLPNDRHSVYDLPPLELSLPQGIVSTLLDELRSDN